VLDQKNQIYFTQSDIHSREHELESITKDQARIRENMKALKGSAEEKALLVRYAKQLDSQEDRLSTLSREIASLRNKQAQEQQKLDEIVQQVTLDESF
jgi:chromosome segregation ATPase